MVLDHGLEGTRVPASVAANPIDRTHREVHQRPQGGKLHLHPGIHPAGHPREDRADPEEIEITVLLFAS